MKKISVKILSICAVLAALHLVLELFATVRIGNDLKITFATLPFIAAGMLVGPLAGFLTGFVGAFLSQLLTFGFNWTNFIWIIPPAVMGLASGLIYKAFGRKKQAWRIIVTVVLSNLVLVILNLAASWLDGVVIYKYWTMEVLIGLIPLRLAVGAGLSAVYSIVMIPLCKVAQDKI